MSGSRTLAKDNLCHSVNRNQSVSECNSEHLRLETQHGVTTECKEKFRVHSGKESLWSFLSSKLEDTSMRIYHLLLMCLFHFIKTIQLIPRKKKNWNRLSCYTNFHQHLKRALIL
jgi:hypothetical protein